MARRLHLFFLALLFLGVLATGVAQQVITTTTTTVITLPGTSYTTTMTLGGEMGEATVQYPGYIMINVEKRPDQTCIIVINPMEPPTEQVIEFPGQTIAMPGTTFVFSTVLTNPTFVTVGESVEEGYTTTRTGMDFYEFATTYSIDGFTTTVFMPIPVYGEIIESCESITVKFENTFILETVPATVFIAWGFPGTTFIIPGTTYTVTQELGDMTVPPPTTKTTTRKGTTQTFSTSTPGTTYTTTVSMEPTTITTVIEEPGQVITSTITTVITIEETGSPTTGKEETQTTGTATQETAGTPTTQVTTTPKPPKTTQTQTAAQPQIPIGLIIIAASAILILVGAVILFLRR